MAIRRKHIHSSAWSYKSFAPPTQHVFYVTFHDFDKYILEAGAWLQVATLPWPRSPARAAASWMFWESPRSLLQIHQISTPSGIVRIMLCIYHHWLERSDDHKVGLGFVSGPLIIREFRPRDATTNPTLVLQAVKAQKDWMKDILEASKAFISSHEVRLVCVCMIIIDKGSPMRGYWLSCKMRVLLRGGGSRTTRMMGRTRQSTPLRIWSTTLWLS